MGGGAAAPTGRRPENRLGAILANPVGSANFVQYSSRLTEKSVWTDSDWPRGEYRSVAEAWTNLFLSSELRLETMSRYLINPFDKADRQIKVNGRWIVATIAPRNSWPKRRQLISYDEIDSVLPPQTNDQSPAVAVRADAHGIDASSSRGSTCIMRPSAMSKN